MPLDVARRKGDATPFLNHIAKLLPDENDRELMLSYMAALVQYQGHKFNWCVFLQGTHGNGKSLLSMCVKAAIGERYSHMPRADGLTEKFNGWLAKTTFCGVEDIYLPTGREEILEILKPMITLEYQPIREMNKSQTMMRVCCNFILNSNHQDGIRKTKEDRRFAPLFCAQQEPEHLERDGLDAEYFSVLYEWLERKGGYAIVSEYLHTYKIPASRRLPYLKGRAPITTSTEEAVTMSYGRVEQEIIEAINEERYGFCGGWISSIELDNLLTERKMSHMVSRQRRKTVLKTLGYEWHPELYKGRSTTIINGVRPTLFIRKGHVSCNIKNAAAISAEYAKAQPGGFLPAIQNNYRR